MAYGNISAAHANLIYDAALKSFWRRNALKKFLRSCGVSESFLRNWNEDESKRDLLDRLFLELSREKKAGALLRKMSDELCAQTAFPDLKGFEESARFLEEAEEAVAALRGHEKKLREETISAQERAEAEARFRARQQEVQRSKADLRKLKDALEALLPKLGTRVGGDAFQDWFYDLVAFFEIIHRRPYKSAGREIDGSLTVEGTTYLVELKFTEGQSGGPDIDSLLAKVNSKADNTMGIFVAMSGYSKVAIDGASSAKTPLLLLDHGHLYAVLDERMKLQDIIVRLRRHASQTGRAFLAVSDFGG